MLAGYAVVDIETTGLFPGKHDRIAEVGVVHVNRDGMITDEWCTLINPQRDLGPQHIHGIQAADTLGAPTFAEIAGDLAVRLAGRVIVAHNLSFDARFLVSEYRRVGAEVPINCDSGLCTMRMSDRFLDSPARSLAACCASAGVDHAGAHSALPDARACAGLLAQFIRLTTRPEPWVNLLRAAGLLKWPTLAPGCGRITHRNSADTTPRSFLARMVDRLPRVSYPPQADDYLALLDRALLDRYLSATEQDALLEVARTLGLSFADAMDLHRAYLLALAEAAWQDAVVTDDERKDLLDVADLLGLARDEVDIALWAAKDRQCAGPSPRQFCLKAGDLVAFTGQMKGSRDEWEQRAVSAGLRVNGSGVTARTRLLIAADPDSQSGKAGKARRYAIPIVTEEAFARLIAQLEGQR